MIAENNPHFNLKSKFIPKKGVINKQYKAEDKPAILLISPYVI